MAVGTYEPTRTDWVQSVLFDRGYLSRIRGEAIKVYLVVIEAGGGEPDRSVTISLNQLTADPAVDADGDRQSGAARGSGLGGLDDPPARQGEDLLHRRPPGTPGELRAATGAARERRPTRVDRVAGGFAGRDGTCVEGRRPKAR